MLVLLSIVANNIENWRVKDLYKCAILLMDSFFNQVRQKYFRVSGLIGLFIFSSVKSA